MSLVICELCLNPAYLKKCDWCRAEKHKGLHALTHQEKLELLMGQYRKNLEAACDGIRQGIANYDHLFKISPPPKE